MSVCIRRLGNSFRSQRSRKSRLLVFRVFPGVSDAFSLQNPSEAYGFFCTANATCRERERERGNEKNSARARPVLITKFLSRAFRSYLTPRVCRARLVEINSCLHRNYTAILRNGFAGFSFSSFCFFFSKGDNNRRLIARAAQK